MRRFGRAAIAVTIGCTLAVPVGAVAGLYDKKDDVESRLEQIRSRIDPKATSAARLRARIDSLNVAITNLQIEINNIEAEIKQVESEVRSEQARIDRTQEEIDKIIDIATEQAVLLYKSGSMSTIDALLNSKSLAELDARVELLGVAAQNNTGALIKYGRLQARIEAQKRELFQKKMALTKKRADHAKYISELGGRKQELAADLTKLNVQLQPLRNKESHLEGSLAQIEADIRAAQARNAVESLGTSASGFIWPINGAVTSPYGYRWGRMHTGIDIDGYSGQPIVAANGGTVIMSSYYSGYGNTVIIDHGGGISTLYGHMSGYNTSNGASVDQGQIIGYVGCTGSCTGDHLHFEVRVNGSPVDPMTYLP